ncbi:MAG: hypothetical protein QF713_04140 [Dehalococcoidales bacterium]|jgi:hypothetical protein|nr:hypothetical protein [Dehalococcoidales bacterium]MDP7525508.1 hypothetical protein [Dehalococcoidales bacterium]
MNLALAIEIIIIAGFFGGRAAHWIKFPMITGYIIVGVLLITVSRFTGKYLGTIAGATMALSPEVVRKYLGLALLP